MILSPLLQAREPSPVHTQRSHLETEKSGSTRQLSNISDSSTLIPFFPKLKKVTLDDKKIIDTYIHRHAPYSDYYFASLWSWNINNTIQIASLHNNLVIKFRDYITGEKFYSFFGNNQINQTIHTLIEKAESEGISPHLKLVPEHNFHLADFQSIKMKYHILEDENNFDYLLSVDKISAMVGKKLHHKRKLLRRFERQHSGKIDIQAVSDAETQKKIIALFFKWQNKTDKDRKKNHNELNALLRLFHDSSYFDAKAMLLYVNNNLIGFSIFEIINAYFAISSFQKADIAYEGVYEQLNFRMAQYLKEHKCSYINIEQDLGIEGLRRAKKDYDPEYLKKYIISKK